MSQPLGKLSRSADETMQLGGVLAGIVNPGDLLLLIGELGSGKTTFVKGFAKACGIVQEVTSPTFILARSYPLSLPHQFSTGEGISSNKINFAVTKIIHCDAYRLESWEEVVDLGFDEELDEGAVVLVEWGEKVKQLMGSSWLEVHFETVDMTDNTRKISFLPVGSDWQKRLWLLKKAILKDRQ
ncbi:MAG: tRNA (adenosine(37)-N6)-threonylcarbamoyltransferase complex ATPase subunit type 1 TsaE [Actinobacteria bacterium]|nr:tRNA (adenosine(37)-N6)-threonylcarbamoyltransferase complex ATPase subunit type 1 TsaE [Actinomycetota bacterium]MCL6105422.1 tRNA (adenosine(37)-N6)-threonylcarbamoyltransferase complex ATPase subunit type 1 TsaE [Actinomycetota bacterium]